MGRDALIADILAALYAAPLKPELWDTVVERIARASGVSQAALIEHSIREDKHTIVAFFGDPVREGGPIYERDYGPYDEWAKRLVNRSASGRVLRGEEVWPEESMRRSVFYNEFLRKYDVCQMACILGGRGALEGLSLYRGPNELPIGDHQIDILELLLPHLETSLATRRRLVEVNSRNSDLEVAIEHVASAFVLLDGHGKPLVVNRAAREICDKRRGLLLTVAGLAAQGLRENAVLRGLILKAVRGAEGTGGSSGAMLISRSGGQPLQVVVSPIPRKMIDPPHHAAAILCICDPEESGLVPVHLLRDLYQLTPAEARLALCLHAGNSLQEAAEVLGVGQETVRTQLKATLHKTGKRRQAELVRLLSGINGLTAGS